MFIKIHTLTAQSYLEKEMELPHLKKKTQTTLLIHFHEKRELLHILSSNFLLNCHPTKFNSSTITHFSYISLLVHSMKDACSMKDDVSMKYGITATLRLILNTV